LADDREPAYWLKLAEVPEGEPPPTETDFIVRVCCNEQYPFRFDEAKDDDGKPVAVRTEVSALWAEGLADYAIKGLEGEFALERKADDLFSSLSHRGDSLRELLGADVRRPEARATPARSEPQRGTSNMVELVDSLSLSALVLL
jgi:hypothetical protein